MWLHLCDFFKFISLIMLGVKIHIFVVFCGLFKHNFIFLKPSTIYIILANYVSKREIIINIDTKSDFLKN
jgi:hypothetical protein